MRSSSSANWGIDEPFVEEMVEQLGASEFQSLLLELERTAEGLFRQIDAAVLNDNIEATRGTGHRLGGLLAQFGIVEASGLSRALWHVSTQQERKELISAMHKVYDASILELKGVLIAPKPLAGAEAAKSPTCRS